MEIGADLVAGAEAFELVEPGEAAFDDPALGAQSGPGATPRRAMRAVMPRSRSLRRYLS